MATPWEDRAPQCFRGASRYTRADTARVSGLSHNSGAQRESEWVCLPWPHAPLNFPDEARSTNTAYWDKTRTQASLGLIFPLHQIHETSDWKKMGGQRGKEEAGGSILVEIGVTWSEWLLCDRSMRKLRGGIHKMSCPALIPDVSTPDRTMMIRVFFFMFM